MAREKEREALETGERPLYEKDFEKRRGGNNLDRLKQRIRMEREEELKGVVDGVMSPTL